VTWLEQLLAWLRSRRNKGPSAPLIGTVRYNAMLRLMTIPYTFDGKDQDGVLGETISGARVWQAGTLVAAAKTTFTPTNPTSGNVVVEVDVPTGTTAFQMAFLDAQGAEGLKASFTHDVLNKGPSAPVIGAITSVPKV